MGWGSILGGRAPISRGNFKRKKANYCRARNAKNWNFRRNLLKEAKIGKRKTWHFSSTKLILIRVFCWFTVKSWCFEGPDSDSKVWPVCCCTPLYGSLKNLLKTWKSGFISFKILRVREERRYTPLQPVASLPPDARQNCILFGQTTWVHGYVGNFLFSLRAYYNSADGAVCMLMCDFHC